MLAYMRKYLIILVICILGTGYWIHSSVSSLAYSVHAVHDQVDVVRRMAAKD